MGYADGATGSYLHDPAGRLTEVSVTSGGVTVPYASYTYDADGRQTSELIHAAGGATRDSGYDAAGRLVSLTEVLPNTTSTWETYTAELTYRPDGRVASETVNSGPTVDYGYDAAGQLTSAADGVRDRSWTYGTRGNRLTAVDGGATTVYLTNPNGSVAKITEGTHTSTYFYDDAARRVGVFHKTGTTSTGSTTNGVTTEGLTSTIQISAPGTTTSTEYRRYDADGKLATSDTISGGTAVTRTYHWDTTGAVPQVIEAKNQGALWFKATWGTQRIAFKAGTAAPQWFQYDARGSVIRTDPSNTDVVVGPDAYDPFGGQDGPTGPDRIGYRGELASSDLVYLRARNYDPDTGAFTSRDPLDGIDGTPTLANAHHYTDNDPLNNEDPTGLRVSDAELHVGADWEVIAHLLEVCENQSTISLLPTGIPMYTCGQFLKEFGASQPSDILLTIIAELTGARAMARCSEEGVGISRTCIGAMTQMILFASSGAFGVGYSDDIVRARSSLSFFEEASASAFKAADEQNYFVKNIHLAGGPTRKAKFAAGLDHNAVITEALRSEGAMFRANGEIPDTFRVVADLGRPIGTNGQTRVRIIVSMDGRVINAFPVNSF